jgi:5-methylcytosine-specific restriction endonuclease McrA
MGKPMFSPEVMGRRRAANSERRAKTRGAQRVERFNVLEIYERDGWRCGICGKKASRKPWPHPLSATLDHVIPLSEGGEHTRANSRCAHLSCNSSRRNLGGDEQLRLIG